MADDSGVASLTKRELEIAELITDRLTNPQIAGKLFLSKKTVESHIRNVFVKLGASSRVEVARMVERERRDRVGIPGAP
jgi:DNA-binding NarL/FixJ family response regulator